VGDLRAERREVSAGRVRGARGVSEATQPSKTVSKSYLRAMGIIAARVDMYFSSGSVGGGDEGEEEVEEEMVEEEVLRRDGRYLSKNLPRGERNPSHK